MRASLPPTDFRAPILAGQRLTWSVPPADEECSLFLQPSEAWVLLEPAFGLPGGILRSRHPEIIGTRCNQVGSYSYCLASKGDPAGPVADQVAPRDITPRAARSPSTATHRYPRAAHKPPAGLEDLIGPHDHPERVPTRAKSPRGENGPANVHKLPKATNKTARKGQARRPSRGSPPQARDANKAVVSAPCDPPPGSQHFRRRPGGEGTSAEGSTRSGADYAGCRARTTGALSRK